MILGALLKMTKKETNWKTFQDKNSREQADLLLKEIISRKGGEISKDYAFAFREGRKAGHRKEIHYA